ncbi:hypothetical protein DFH09DRAFT_1194284 [Mycena vulgaris]|nr:hypothetical protein DFH09DRAFT_1194284 [Mycena vulgaris]
MSDIGHPVNSNPAHTERHETTPNSAHFHRNKCLLFSILSADAHISILANPFNWDYNVTKSAFALFFKNDHKQRAFRLELPDIGMELTDGAYIDRDPEGFIDYDKESNFENSNKNHRYEIAVDTVGGRTYAVVVFRYSLNEKSYAKHRVTRAAEMENHSGTGNWIDREVTSSYTRIEKKANSRVVTVTITSDAAGTWDAGSTHFSPNSFVVTRHTHYKGLTDLRNAKYVNYDDRIAFYKNDWTGRDFVGFFIRKFHFLFSFKKTTHFQLNFSHGRRKSNTWNRVDKDDAGSDL